MSTAQLQDDERAKLLASKRRRLLLLIFDELSEDGFHRVDVRTLADDLKFVESGGTTPDDDAIDDAERALRHVHLPQLADHDVIDRVATQPTAQGLRVAAVAPTARADRLLEHVDEQPTDWGDA